MHKVISYKQLPQGFRPVVSGLPFRAVSNLVSQHVGALVVKVGERFSVYVPVEKKPQERAVLAGATTVLDRLARS